MCLQIAVFTIISCIFQPQVDNVPQLLINTFETISAFLAIYFLCIELVTASGVNKNELAASWMELVLNFASPILILTC